MLTRYSVTYLGKGKIRCSGHSEKGNVNYNHEVRTDFRKEGAEGELNLEGYVGFGQDKEGH